MIEVHYGVVRMDGRWTVIGDGLKLRSYDTQAQAKRAARRMADQVVVVPVHLHLQVDADQPLWEAIERFAEPKAFATESLEPVVSWDALDCFSTPGVCYSRSGAGTLKPFKVVETRL